MRIIHTTLRYPPSSGGVEDYVKEIVERTRDIDAQRDVRVLTSRLRTHNPVSELNPDLLVDDPPYIQRLHHARTPFFSYPRLQALDYYLGHHQPDIVHAHAFWYQPADVAARFAKKNNKKFIFQPYYYNHGNRQKPVWQLYKNLVGKKTLSAADIVAVISPQEKKLIEKDGFDVKRFELVPPGIDTTRFLTPRKNPFLKRGITGKILLSVGRLSSGKGLADLLEVFALVLQKENTAQLALVGEDFGEKQELEKQADKLGIKGNVHFLGKLDEAELIGAYQHADLFLHGSFYEAFGIVLAESLAAGTPVVAREVGAVPFVVPHEKAGLLFKSRQQCFEHIMKLLENPQLAKDLGESGKKRVEEKFTWEKTIKKINSLYEELSS